MLFDIRSHFIRNLQAEDSAFMRDYRLVLNQASLRLRGGFTTFQYKTLQMMFKTRKRMEEC